MSGLHEGTQGEQRYGDAVSLTLPRDGGGWVPEPVSMILRRETFLVPAGIRTPDRPARSPAF
jgi:hypothetical protein